MPLDALIGRCRTSIFAWPAAHEIDQVVRLKTILSQPEPTPPTQAYRNHSLTMQPQTPHLPKYFLHFHPLPNCFWQTLQITAMSTFAAAAPETPLTVAVHCLSGSSLGPFTWRDAEQRAAGAKELPRRIVEELKAPCSRCSPCGSTDLLRMPAGGRYTEGMRHVSWCFFVFQRLMMGKLAILMGRWLKSGGWI